MSNEILEMVNHDDNVLLFTSGSAYRKHSGATAEALWQIGQPIYQGVQTGPTSQLMAFGNYSGTEATVVTVKIISATTFAASFDNGVTYGTTTTISRDGIAIDNGIRVQFYATEGFTIDDTWRFTVSEAFFDVKEGSYDKWAVKQYNDGFFFVNIQNPLRYVEEDTVQTLFPCDIISPPRAKFMEIFHHHCVLANVIVDGITYPRKVMWSDIYDFSNFTILDTNEADEYNLTVDEAVQEQVFGTTGVKNIGVHCAVYSPKSITKMAYVGLPKVMQAVETVTGVGNCFPYSLIGYLQIHAFISDENFYTYDGEKTQAVGDPIKDYFFETLTLDVDFRYRVWAYHNRLYNEITWVFVSSASVSGAFDKAVVWNYREDVWYACDVENIHSFVPASVIGVTNTIDQDSQMIDDVADIINDRNVSLELVRLALYGSANGVIYRDETTSDNIDTLITRPAPELVSKDITYGSIQTVKEIDTLVINAGINSDCSGFDVYISTRNSYGDTITYTLLGTWTPTLPEGRLAGFPPKSGKIFRYKFVPKEATAGKGVRQLTFVAWGENVRGAKQEGVER